MFVWFQLILIAQSVFTSQKDGSHHFTEHWNICSGFEWVQSHIFLWQRRKNESSNGEYTLHTEINPRNFHAFTHTSPSPIDQLPNNEDEEGLRVSCCVRPHYRFKSVENRFLFKYPWHLYRFKTNLKEPKQRRGDDATVWTVLIHMKCMRIADGNHNFECSCFAIKTFSSHWLTISNILCWLFEMLAAIESMPAFVVRPHRNRFAIWWMCVSEWVCRFLLRGRRRWRRQCSACMCERIFMHGFCLPARPSVRTPTNYDFHFKDHNLRRLNSKTKR